MGFSIKKLAKSAKKGLKSVAKAAAKGATAAAGAAIKTTPVGAIAAAVYKAGTKEDKKPQTYDDKTGNIITSSNSPNPSAPEPPKSTGFWLFRLFGL